MTIDAPDRSGLYALARAGDARALERLLTIARPDLERYARRHCESEDVEEAVQDALWILYRRLGGLRSIAAFSAWLFQVVRRACLGLARRRRRTVSLDEAPEAQLRDPRASNSELRLVLARVISALPPSYREVLLLRDVQGLSAEEVAELLQVSLAAAKSRLHRGRAMVRAALADEPLFDRAAA